MAEQNSNNVSITGGSITGVSGLGTVTSVGGNGTVNGITLTGTVTSSGSLTLGGTLSGVSLTTQVSGTLPVGNGGTGQTTYTDGQLLIGNTTGNTLAKATLTAGTNISITNGAGAITINATDQFVGTVTSVSGTGTVNGITLTGTVTSSGSLTLGGTLSGVDLATQTTGTLSVSRGGTGATTLTGVVKGNGTSAFTAGTVSLTSEVSGTLPVANGGTGVTTSTGTGSVVLSNSPTFVTPTLGAASATSIATDLGAGGTPAYTFTGDTNTGMWSPAADTLAFSEGGVEAMRITDAGNVGIGTSAPISSIGRSLHLYNSANTGNVASNTILVVESVNRNAVIDLSGTSTATNSVVFSDTVGTSLASVASEITNQNLLFRAGSNTERMRITSAGDVGIGASSPGKRLEINAAGASAAIRIKETAAYGISWDIDVGSTNAMTFNNNAGTVQNYVFLNGNIGIGTSSPNSAARLDVSSTTSGFLPPRMTAVERALILTPPNGLMLYNTTTDKLQVYAAGVWVDLH